MSSNIVYTSTLPKNLMAWLTNTAKELNSTKKDIIVRALMNYREQAKKEELKNSFKRAAKDAEIKAMSEEGLVDYLDQLKSI